MFAQNVSLLSKDVSYQLKSGVEQMKKRDHDINLKFIPEIPRDFCFAYERFSSPAFCVDEFVLQNSRKVQSLEVLREQLNAYLKLLKRSMIELIHEDYTEFINLSANLISFEKSIANLLTPLADFQQETDNVHQQVDQRIQTILNKRSRLAEIRSTKIQINLVKEIVEHFDRVKNNVGLLERNLEQIHDYQNNFERFAIQNAYLLSESEVLIRKFNSSFALLSKNHSILPPKSYLYEAKQSYDDLSKRFFKVLEDLLRFLLRNDNFYDSIPLTECIVRILFMNNRDDILNGQIVEIIRDNFDDIISESYIAKNGSNAMLDSVLESIQNDCEILIKSISTFHPKTRFHIIVKSIWNEFVVRASVRTKSLFSLAKAEQFYNNYQATCKFCSRFLSTVQLESCRKEFEKLSTYNQLMNKFNLNVYFHMKLQQIVPKIENDLLENEFSTLPKSASNSSPKLELFVTQLFYDNIVSIWSDQDRSNDLFPYLWKITVKIISRFRYWIVRSVNIERIIESCKDLERNEVVQRIAIILADTQAFVVKFQQFCDSKILVLWKEYFEQNRNNNVQLSMESMSASVQDTVQQFHSISSQCLLQLIRNEVISSAQINLSLINGIPRLYRRTNKDKPTKASNYIESYFAALGQIFVLMGGNVEQDNIWQKNWFVNVLCEVFTVYKSLAMELLTSVQKTEDSLKKLKKTRTQLPLNGAMSDDDKIRLQIYLDVQQMVPEVRKNIGIELLNSVPPYAELSQTVSSLKNLL